MHTFLFALLDDCSRLVPHGQYYDNEKLGPLLDCLKEARATRRRNVGALKLSNLLQLDRFEEDLNISNVRLRSAPPPQSSRPTPTDPPPLTPAELHDLRQEAKAAVARLRQELGKTPNS